MLEIDIYKAFKVSTKLHHLYKNNAFTNNQFYNAAAAVITHSILLVLDFV